MFAEFSIHQIGYQFFTNMSTTTRTPPSLATGLEIQHEQLLEWAPKLSPALYLDLCKEAGRRNTLLDSDDTCFDVWRGSDFNNFIGNWSPAK